MSDNKKYYYLKMKENFFDTNEMVMLESMQDGFLYSNILVKLYLKAIKYEGKLMFNDRIPYNCNMIATITRHQVGTVEKALKIFEQLGLIDVLSSDEIYIADMQAMIGHTTTESERKKAYREKIKNKQLMLESGTLSQKRPPEIDLDLESKLEKKSTTYNPLHSDDYKIRLYASAYYNITGKEHRDINNSFCFKDDYDVIDEEIIRDHINSNYFSGNADRCYIEYFNTTLDRYR